MPGVFQVKRRGTGAIQDTIFINSAPSVPAGVEGIRHDGDGFDRDIVRGERVESALQPMPIRLSITEEISHLPQPMDAGVGPARTDDARGHAQEGPNGPL